MAKYTITWSEKHTKDVEANNREEAKEKAMKLEMEETLVSIYGITTTKGGD